MKNGIVFNIQKFCIHDGDGIRTCVFLKGCPLRCIWCHNPESFEKAKVLSFNPQKCSLCGMCLDICSARKIKDSVLKIEREKCTLCGKCSQDCLNNANEIIGNEMTASEVFQEIIKDKTFYETSGGGVTISGGEPSFQADFTIELLSLCKNEEINIAIETCGIGPFEFYKKCADLNTTFLYDIKCIDATKHKALTGADNSRILENLQYLMSVNADIILRLPMIPGCNDSDNDIALLSEFLNKNKHRYRYAEIMPYHTLGTAKLERLGQASGYIHDNASDADIARWCALFNSYDIDVKVSK